VDFDQVADEEDLPGDEVPPKDAGPEEWVRHFGEECITVRVYRRDPKSGKYALVQTFPAEEFSEPVMAELWGGGEYQARLCTIHGKYLKHSGFRVAGTPKDPEASTSVPELADDRLARLEELLARQGARADHGGGTAGDVMASAVALATAMQSGQMTLLGPLLEALTANKGGGGGLQDMDAMFSIMERMQDMAAERSGNEDIIKTLGLPLLGQIQKLAEREKGTGPDAPPPDIAPPPSGAGPAPGWATALRPYVPELTQLAAFHADPVYWSRTILSRASDAEFLFMEEQAGREGFPDEFHAWFPDTVQHRPWFATFWAEMVEGVKELRAEDGAEGAGLDAG